MTDVLGLLWQEITERRGGPFGFRFILQPATALFFAVRDGVKDAKTGQPAFLWAVFTDPALCGALLRQGWRSVSKVFFIGLVMDALYQFVVFRRVQLLSMVAVAALLALVPYALARGPVSRLMRRRV